MSAERWLYRAALRLYPADHRIWFGRDMIATFNEVIAARTRRGRMVTATRECGSVLAGAAREWAVKLTTDPAARARCLPDCRLMRPAGVSRREWAAGLDAAIDFHRVGQ